MPCANCFPEAGRGSSRPETGRRIFGQWLGFTRNCSADAALPEADWDIAGAEAQPETRAVGPLIVVLEIGAVVLAGKEVEDAVSHGRHLTADIQVGRITAVSAEHVTLGVGPVVVGPGGNRPVA